jgi:D-galactarolactone cycloisomerase
MAITAVECFQVQWDTPAPDDLSAWVRIHDDSGHVGIGEASPMMGGLASMVVVKHHLVPMLIGADPFDAGLLYQQMLHKAVKLGPEGVLTSALAAIDIALWDIKGKITGKPIYKLLGGAWRTTLPFYASVGGNAGRTPDEVVRAVEARMKDSPALVKMRLDSDRSKCDVDPLGDIERARAVRKLVGDRFPLSFDANNGYSVGAAIRVGRALEELGFTWFEEPLQHYQVARMGEVAQRLDIPVAAGEQSYTLPALADLIAAGVRIIQADPIKMGGFSGMLMVQGLAHAHGVDLIPHMTQPTIGQAVDLHLMATQLHAWAPIELHDPGPRQHEVFRKSYRHHDGVFTLDDTPGLGLELDEEKLSRRRKEVA